MLQRFGTLVSPGRNMLRSIQEHAYYFIFPSQDYCEACEAAWLPTLKSCRDELCQSCLVKPNTLPINTTSSFLLNVVLVLIIAIMQKNSHCPKSKLKGLNIMLFSISCSTVINVSLQFSPSHLLYCGPPFLGSNIMKCSYEHVISVCTF